MSEYFRKFGRFQRDAHLYLLSSALSGMSTGIFLLLYNLYLTALGYQADFVGAALFAGTLGAGLAIFPAGLIIDRWSGKWVLILSNVAIGVVGIGTVLLRQPVPLLLCAFGTGMAAAFTLVINAPFLVRNSAPAERPHLFSLNIFLTQITTVLGEVFGGALPTWFLHNQRWMAALPASLNWFLASQPEPRAYQLALLSAGLLTLPSFLPLFFLSNDRPTPRPARPRPMLAQPVWPWRAWLKNTQRWTKPAYLRAFLLTPFCALVLVQILTSLGAGLLIPYFNLFFVRHLDAQPALFGLIDGTANGLTALTTLCAPWLARRLGRVNSIVLTRLCSLPLLLSIGFTKSLPLAVGLYPLREGTMDMSQGVLQVFSMEVIPEQHQGLANSTYQAMTQIPWAITSSLGGLIIVHAGYSPLFVITALCYLASILLLWGRFGSNRHALEPCNG
ncbi:MAG: MFS transporter [Ktedonobacteraceae bacterium]